MNNEFTITTLAKNPEYYDQVIKLIEVEFDYIGSEYRFEKDFAPLVNPNNFNQCFFILNKSNIVVSHLGFVKRKLIKSNSTMPVIFIGGIATHKDFRNQGLFRNLMNLVIEENKNEAALFILWSNIKDIYEKFHFHLSGAVLELGKNVLTNENNIEGFEETSFARISTKHFEDIKKLYHEKIENQFFTVKRDSQMWETIRHMDSIRLFIKLNDDKKVTDYFCYGKGKDVPFIIHETSLLSSTKLKSLENFKTWAPEFLGETFLNKEMQYTAYIRLGDIKLLNNFFLGLTQNELELISINENSITFNFNKNQFELFHKDFLHGIFGPAILDEFKKYKLSPYITGTDSI
jgi:predicted N-acetyltransferase YhbS